MNAHGGQANEIGVGGGGDGFSQAEGHMVVAWTILKSLLVLDSLIDYVCHICGMVLVMLGPRWSNKLI